MKICLVVHSTYSSDVRIRRYVQTLLDANVEVDVLCLTSSKELAEELPPGLRVYCIPQKRIANSVCGYLFEYGVACFLFTTWLLLLYFRNRYRIIHAHNMPDFLAFSCLVPRLCGCKVILDIHDPMPEFYASKFGGRMNSLPVRLMQLQEKLSTSFVNAVIAANQNFKESLIKRKVPADKITVIRNLPDLRVFDRRQYTHVSKNERFTLIYPGTVAPRYGLDVAIRAVPLLAKVIPNVRMLIIAGHNDTVRELVALAVRNGVSDLVEFMPPIAPDEVPRQLAQAHLGFYPALPDAHMSIATPSKVLEFAFMGLPIVASRLQILQDLFTEDGVMFFEPGNVDEFAERVLKLYRHPELRDELVQRADELFVRKRSWTAERRAYLGLLDGLVESSTLPSTYHLLSHELSREDMMLPDEGKSL